ncbi:MULTISPECIES: hypothetical protein [Aestuariivivens]|uniref:hypothetical protein n=1 Tax=Aestuariivivens TaxID=1820275 RepID=UPI001CBAF546|nr:MULTISPECIES: hypothetical protein [Aestuariivivens]
MNFKNLIFVLAIAFLTFSCSSSSSDDLSNPDSDTSGKTTYNGNVKAIMTSNCTGCHGSPTSNGAPFSLTTYTQVKNRVNSIITAINSSTNPMPPSGGLMPQSTRDIIQKWKDDGLLEN